ncbi:Lysine acetyltransferase (Lysine N(6)-acetyltransferase) (LAT) [Scheffersomyces stipitis CBS 6054]|uniref:Lysine acetyltransferase (Lysine N(6)-acetyltransferase) (LAT) n=1 Tax=Scheffersomyces stipitis (strain ATCC 58785 / CBS 6054 / NBRC 10063 / NRRL Y-11545) TaxID=322104 RepID=A3GF38_PICST|nr:Lysine acetyltransferase (Lysine N(6)-acetyltransferase) (LAT) [Scheffersomyces stipitis CBS 6054]EAZ63279.2 Lysine acetyltransferase (Lysine N(6)-acetyltransferase) (LAT) [Scheffersomyces stipitis CBS 6054]
MPSPDSADLYQLELLTDSELITFTRKQNSQSWKGRLSADDYVIRETVLGKSKMISHSTNKLLVFMLKKRGDDTPLSSIELLIRDGWRFDYVDGKTTQRTVSTGCIGGVFTYPENRGKGYARIMVDKLVDIAVKEYLGPDGFVFLYSEVGEYYAKNGFKSFPVDLVNIPLQNVEAIETEVSANVSPISYHQFAPYLMSHNKQVRRKIAAKVDDDHLSRVTLVPNSDIVDWFHLRSKYISYKMFHEKNDNERIDFVKESYEQITKKFDSLQPNHFGLELKDDSGNLVGYIVWTYDWSNMEENYATVLNIYVADGYDREEKSLVLLKLLRKHLLTNSDNEGQTTTKIVIWESEVSTSVLNFLTSKWCSKSGLENGSRSAILINDPSSQQKLLDGSLIWDYNDKLSWF